MSVCLVALKVGLLMMFSAVRNCSAGRQVFMPELKGMERWVSKSVTNRCCSDRQTVSKMDNGVCLLMIVFTAWVIFFVFMIFRFLFMIELGFADFCVWF